MRLTLGEIRTNAVRFAAEWKDAHSEQADAQEFWIDLFSVFGVKRRAVASFEEKVHTARGTYARLDVFYTAVMIGEHKSRGEDLTKAKSQAFEYVQDLQRAGRDADLPRYIVLSDFARIVVFDLDSDDPGEPIADFLTADLHEHFRHLLFLSGQVARPVDPEDPVNIQAVELLGELHDALEAGGYSGHALERFLVRILFCLFADDTGIFEPDVFKAIVTESRIDGSGLGPVIEQVFRELDKPADERQKTLPEDLANLPYVNGQLFSERLDIVNFNPKTRDALIAACEFNWSRISPAVFGSLFQSIMAGEEGKKKRRQIGAHYTSERDIMKLIRSLFLDDLEAELEKTATKPKLLAFQEKLASLNFLDPACGCGNFLVVAYREIRRLEIETLQKYHAKKKGEVQRVLNIAELLRVDVDQMHGIEIEEWPARIAEVAMWLVDHQMNTRVGEVFGEPVLRLPLKKSANIVHANALRTDWADVLPPERCSYVLGNPPFVGKKEQNAEQKADFKSVWGDVKGSSVLDFVTCWHRCASLYIAGTAIRVGFVSTNSICQGEQVAILWEALFGHGVQIHFAHRTFPWESEARGAAHVHVVIVGFGLTEPVAPILIDYENDTDRPVIAKVSRINAYLVNASDILVRKRTRPICDVPPIAFGNMPNDGGNLLLTTEERDELLRTDPLAIDFVRRIYGSEEFIHDIPRYCLWLIDASPARLRSMPGVMRRVAAVHENRLKSSRGQTRELAKQPSLFGEIRQPTSRYLGIPKTSSERREYIPIGLLEPETITTTELLMVEAAQHWHFGTLTSSMHMAWTRTVCGRLESRYRYSAKLVYNNFPWPEPTDAQRGAVESAAQSVLDARDQYPDATLADLYDPLAMPKPLRDAHRALDRTVDRCYRKAPFPTERARVEFLFARYQELAAPLTAKPKAKRRTPKQ